MSVGASAATKRRWKQQVQAEAISAFSAPLNDDDLSITITFFYNTPPDFDTDNISKPICDALNGIAYNDDRQLMERHARRRDINGSFRIRGADPKIAVAIAEGDEFVAIEIKRVGSGAVEI